MGVPFPWRVLSGHPLVPPSPTNPAQCIGLDKGPVVWYGSGRWLGGAAEMRTALRSNEAAQGIFKLIAALGAAGYEAALLLVRFEFDITRAALQLGLARGCGECAAGRRRDARRGCEACVASLRQRVHRVQDRAVAMLGEAAPATRHRRTRVVYGADRHSCIGSGQSVYETTAGSLETGDPDELRGAEGE